MHVRFARGRIPASLRFRRPAVCIGPGRMPLNFSFRFFVPLVASTSFAAAALRRFCYHKPMIQEGADGRRRAEAEVVRRFSA